MTKITPTSKMPEDLVADLRRLIAEARWQAAAAVNVALTLLYWRVGDRIRREVLGNERAGYGEEIYATLSRELAMEFGRGFEATNLEDAILRELEMFLLELGAGFCFVSRQKRIQLDGDDFYIDLLLYNRKLKRLVALELKQGSFRAEYKGQMELYLRWLAKYEREEGEGPPLGIILCAGASTKQIELLELDAAGIHAAEYLTVLPAREVLEHKLQDAIAAARLRFEPARPESETP